MEFCQSEKMGTLGVRAVKKLSNFKSKVCFRWFWAKIKLIIPKSRVHRKDQYKTVVTILYPKKNQIILCLWLKSRLFAKQIIIRIVMIHLGIRMLYSLWYSINVHYHNLLYLLKGRNGKHYEGQISHIIDFKVFISQSHDGRDLFF